MLTGLRLRQFLVPQRVPRTPFLAGHDHLPGVAQRGQDASNVLGVAFQRDRKLGQ
jgi:hypothetical protein